MAQFASDAKWIHSAQNLGHTLLSIATPPWPIYEPLQVKYFERLAPNGANGQVIVVDGGLTSTF